MTRSFPNMYRLQAKDKIKMAMKRGFNDEVEEEETQMSDPMDLKEATLADKITKEALAKVMAHRKASALTAAQRTATAPTPALENASGPTPTPETAPTLSPWPKPSTKSGERTAVQMGNWHWAKIFRRMFASTGFFNFLLFSVPFLMVISHKPYNVAEFVY